VPTLYLASTSPARKQILQDLGLQAIILRPDVDEELAVDEMTEERTPEAIALHLAKLKAESVLDPSIDGLVIGGDSVFHFEGHNYGKPLEPEIAKQRWLAMVGKSGTLFSGLWVIDHTGGSVVGSAGEVSHASVHFASSIDERDIDAYVATGEPLQVAGAFTLDARGGAFIDKVDGDPHAVVGMSGASLRRLINSLGHRYSDLWAENSD
jgi:septum formation protein